MKIHFTFPLILAVFGIEAWVGGTWVDAVHAVLMIAAVFVCVVLHEFGHSLQVMRYGIKVRDIVLLPIGGMARAERIPENPWQEIVVAISGPLVNFALAILFFVTLWVTGIRFELGGNFLSDLLTINIVLGTFNLIPAFPMDGGRILRGLLATKLPYLRATRYARAVGQVIALVFVVVGFLNSALLMLPVIAVFIFFGAMSEENLIRARMTLEHRRVRDLVEPGPVMNLNDSIAAVANASIGRAAAVAVVDDARTTLGVVSGAELMFALGEGRGNEPVSTVARYDFPVLGADMSAIQAYYFLKAERASFAGVVEEGRFLGLVHFERFESEAPRETRSA